MSTGSGIASQVGWANESTYGTFVAPAMFLGHTKFDINKIKNTAQGQGLGAGRLMALGQRRVVHTRAGGGTFELEAVNKGMGKLFQQLMGGTSTIVQQGATAAWLQTHPLGDPVGKSLSIQAGVPDLGGTVRPFSFVGCKILSMEFTFDIAGGIVMTTIEVDAKDYTEAQALGTASYTTIRPFVGTDVSVKVGTFGAEAAVTGVKKITVKVTRPMATDRFYAGASGLKAEPLLNDYTTFTGTITSDYVDKTIWHDRFTNDTPTSVVIEAVGNLIASTFFDTIRFRLPQVFLDGDTPDVDGADVVSGDFNYQCLFDGTNNPSIEYMSTDTTIL